MENPKDFTASVSDGLVSGVRQFEGYKIIQTTAPISHGSSGGPLLNDAGEVVGITEADLEGGQNLNIAIPVNYVKPLLQFSDQSPPRTPPQFNPGVPKTAPPPQPHPPPPPHPNPTP